MKRNVLIVDDDQEFSQLLKGIYQQADYEVFTAVNGDLAIETLQSKTIQLVVMDQQLQGGSLGSDLLRKFKQMEINAPVIMVSGYLDDETIREMIRDGVAGVFIKPLNIFSLLKKSSAVLEERSKGKLKGVGGGASVEGGPSGLIGQIEGLSERGARFVKRANEASGFKRNLLLIGPPGTLFEEIAKDIVQVSDSEERIAVYSPGQIKKDALDALFEGESAERATTLVLLEADNYSEDEVEALLDFADERGGSASPLRMIFCLSDSVETLYDEGKIDEEFYLFLGSNELQVPPLREMPEDLVALAKREVMKISRDAVFDNKVRSLLLDYDWPENMLELRSVIIRASSLSQPMAPSERHFAAALKGMRNAETGASSRETSLIRFLKHEKRQYRSALDTLLNPESATIHE